jgi:hypothetical protein
VTTPNDDEEKLRRGFAKLRKDDERRAPRFDDIVKKGPPRAVKTPWGIVVPLASAAAAAAVFLLWCNMQSMTASQPTAAAPAPGPVDQPAAAEDGKQSAAAASRPATSPANVRVDSEPLGFLLALPGSTSLESASDLDTSLLFQGRSR